MLLVSKQLVFISLQIEELITLYRDLKIFLIISM